EPGARRRGCAALEPGGPLRGYTAASPLSIRGHREDDTRTDFLFSPVGRVVAGGGAGVCRAVVRYGGLHRAGGGRRSAADCARPDGGGRAGDVQGGRGEGAGAGGARTARRDSGALEARDRVPLELAQRASYAGRVPAAAGLSRRGG